MPLAAIASTIAALATGSWTVFIVGLAVEAFLLALLYSCMAYHFRGVNIDPAQLNEHLARYASGDDANSDDAFKAGRLRDYKKVALTYYNLTTAIFHKIWGPHYSMGLQFPCENLSGGETRIDRWMNYPQAQSLYQGYLALSLRADENSVIGDFGCGIGGPTRCIAQMTGAKIKAVNINPMHLAMMKKLNEDAKIAHRIELICADYHNTPIEANSLDGLYMCESAACTFDHKVLCKEVFRVLKPGARFTGFDWQMTDKFDDDNAEHRRIRFLLEKGVGVPRLVPMSYMREALQEAGFDVVTVRNHNDFGVALGSKPWDALFNDGAEPSAKHQFKAWLSELFLFIFRAAAFVRVVDPAVPKALGVMMACREGMVRGGPRELDIFTPMAYWLAIKPAK